jgi:hypothetical protein
MVHAKIRLESLFQSGMLCSAYPWMYSSLPPPAHSISVCSGEVRGFYMALYLVINDRYVRRRRYKDCDNFSLCHHQHCLSGLLSIGIPGNFWYKLRSSGSTHKAKSSMLMGHPCLTEL